METSLETQPRTSPPPARAAAAARSLVGSVRRHPQASGPERHVEQLLGANRAHYVSGGAAEAAQAIRSVGIVGAGQMGTSIACIHLQQGYNIHLSDAAQTSLDRATIILGQSCSELAVSSGPSPVSSHVAAGANKLHTSTALEQLADCDLVLEAIVENESVKKKVFGRLETCIGENTLLASNTSTISLDLLAAGLQRPGRFCGIHYCAPVSRRKLVEIVRGSATSSRAVETVVAYARALGKVPIVVADRPGFLVNRVLMPYFSAGLSLLSNGVELRRIETAARSFGMSLGPFSLMDTIGLDTSVMAALRLYDTFRDRMAPSPILPAVVKAGRLGRKCGRGFFLYDADTRHDSDEDEQRNGRMSKGSVDPELQSILDRYVRHRRKLRRDEIVARLILPMLLEATRAIDEGVVEYPGDVDLGVIFGLGFPRSKGGLLFWADSHGPHRILKLLEPLQAEGKQFEATDYLHRLADHGTGFYAA